MMCFQAAAYLLIKEALQAQMSQKVEKEEKKEMEGIPLIELLRLAGGDSQKEEVEKVCILTRIWLQTCCLLRKTFKI